VIGLLTGRVLRRLPGRVLLEVGGVGYDISIPLSTFYALPVDGASATLEIHTLVREDAIQLFGFATLPEKSVFEALLAVSGVGPKVALAVLAGMSPEEIVGAIERNDAPRLRAIPGVGRKLAERIALELKERVGKLAVGRPHAEPGLAPATIAGEEAESALLNLGYGAAEAREALERARRAAPAPGGVEMLLREALRILAR